MQIVYIIVCLLILVGFTAMTILRLSREVRARKNLMLSNLRLVEEEIDQKRAILEDLSGLNLAFTPGDEAESLQAEVAQEEENLRTEKGKITIAQAEIEAVDVRLRELEEVERELESSQLEASRELEMLRLQENEIQARNKKLREQLEGVLIQFDRLLVDLESSTEAVARLTRGQNELIQTQKKIQFYEQEISLINRKYVELKRAYDALDIEYAQLYEKHSQG